MLAVWLSLATFREPVLETAPVAVSYSSAVASVVGLSCEAVVHPPTSKILPLRNIVAVWDCRPTSMGVLVENVIVGTSKVSVLLSSPPATKTLPPGKRVDVCADRDPTMAGVAAKTPATGSYSSARINDAVFVHGKLPAIRTRLSFNRVAV